MKLKPGLYAGEVVHARVRPVRHKLSYKVFMLLLDVADLDVLGARLRWFSHNGRNLFAVRDRDHGDGKTPLLGYLRGVAAQAGYADEVTSFRMLCFPRMLGFGFNPLTTYFGLDASGEPVLMIYEVSNTFGQRQTYVVPAGGALNGVVSHRCDKEFFVSPFNQVKGEYLFHFAEAGDDLTPDLTLGVALKTDGQALLRAHFRGTQRELTDRALLRAAAEFGWLSVKAVVGIHWEALKLFIKGLRLVPQPKTPKFATTFVDEGHAHHKGHPAE